MNFLGVYPCACCAKIIRAPVVCPEQGVHPNDDHPDRQNRQRRKFEAKLSILLPSGAFKQVKLNSLKLNFLQVNLFILTFS